MDEFWFWIISFISALVILVGVPYNCKKSSGTNQKVVLIGNGITVGILALTILFMGADSLIRSQYERKYSREGGGLFESFTYVDTVDGYDIYSFYTWTDEADIAVPSEQCGVPLLARVYPDVIVYYDELKPLYKDVITLEGRKCYISGSVEAVFTDFTGIILIILLIDIPLTVLFNLIEIIVVIVQNRSNSEM